ncbi:MAG: hypothetical protein JWN43_3576 [Gammaproteobacteria bacterium]|nr:hypothetical protein [Gammaproteobacteria bacterium]
MLFFASLYIAAAPRSILQCARSSWRLSPARRLWLSTGSKRKMARMSDQPGLAWPEFPLGNWRDTYATLHMWMQIVGKTRLALAPMENHWWQVALYVTTRGLTTSPMPYGALTLAVEFDFIAHRLCIGTSQGSAYIFPLTAMSVAEFFARYTSALRQLGIEPKIMPSPVEVEVAVRFQDDHEHASYDAGLAHRCWRILLDTERVMKRYRGRFGGKQSPVNFFWGSFDLATTRFSGRRAPRHPGGAPNCPDRVMVEAYSHECSSCGFWPGDGESKPPAFYAYAYPEPAGYPVQAVRPTSARYDLQAREFLLPYDALLAASDPDEVLLSFFETTYAAAADLGGWDRASLERR